MSIKIPVSASINAAEVGAEIDKLGQAIAKANKVKYEPVSGTTIKNLEQVERKFRSLLEINREMARRVKLSGQGDKGFFDVDFSKVYENPQTRARKMQQAFQYVTGGGFSGGGRGNSHGGAGGAITNAVTGAAQAGLRATNGATAGVGGVVANSIGAPSIGAGLAGLMGGILALGVGKIVSAAVEKLDEAESNAWANDRLKRMIGDTQVSFKALQGVVESGSKSLSVTYAEGGRLATQFAKLGNMTASQYNSVGDEITNAGGMSKSFGLDPSQGVNFMGTMRGLRLTQDTNDSRKLGLIIGETIAKSGAFSKADEVMEAISGYATAQARSSLSANTTGYASALAGLTGSGMVGLDVGGSASILNRANAALQGGGAAGESSQFFTAMLGAKYGLDPFQMQAWREGGAFATLDGTFGSGSMASKFGMKGPGGDKTLLGANIEMLREKYGNRSPGELAHATGRHLGVSMQQAMALLKYDPKQLGGIEKSLAASGFDITKLNAESISTLGRLETGGKGEMAAVAQSLLGRSDLSGSERDELRAQSESGNFNKEFLMKLVASRGQEVTDGKNIHDTKVAIENIKTDMAQKLIPLTQGIRDGIMYMAGGGKQSRYEVSRDIEGLESKDRMRRITSAADSEQERINADAEEQKWKVLLDPNNKGGIQNTPGWDKIQNGTATKEEVEDFKRRAKSMLFKHGSRHFSDDAADKLAAIEGEKKRRTEENNARKDRELEAERKNHKRRLDEIDKADKASAASEKSLNDIADPTERKNVGAMLDTIGSTEGAGYNTIVGGGKFSDYSKHPNVVGLRTKDGPSTAAGKYQITYTTWKRIAKKLGLTDFSPESQDKAAIELMRERGALSHVKDGNFATAVSKLGHEWQSLPSGASANQGKRSWSFFDKAINKHLRNRAGTPMPEGGSPGGADGQRFIFDAAPIEIIHKNERGEPTGQRQVLATSIRPASPFGTERFS